MSAPSESADVVIVGGGTAGCVLAARLSEDSGRRVVLVEGGRDTEPGNVPDDVLDPYPHRAYYNSRYHWSHLKVRLGGRTVGPRSQADRKYEQGRIMGGTSSINGMMAVRGLPSDFDAWMSDGAEGWSWDDVSPYFVKLESDADIQNELHGRDGPMPIMRLPRDAWPGFSQAACRAFERAGFEYRWDHNGGDPEGIFAMPVFNTGGHRVSTAMAYLNANARKRPNLNILSETEVEDILFEGRRATGVVVSRKGERRTLTGREIIVSAGVMQSPALLLRAGIGPASHLADLGIEIRANRPGVGENLQDHPTVAVASYIRSPARMPAQLRRHIHLGVRYSSGHANCPAGDMYILPVNQVAWHAAGRSFATMLIWANRSFSRGRVRLRSRRPRDDLHIDLNLLSDERDLARLADGVRRVAAIFRDAELAEVAPEPFTASYSDRVRRLSSVTPWNGFVGLVGAVAMGMGPIARSYLLQTLIAPDCSLAEALVSESSLADWIRRNVNHGWHGAGSCRIGRADDARAVVDSQCRVHGVAALRVIDASVMPNVVSANTSTTTIMIAEKVADQIRAEGR